MVSVTAVWIYIFFTTFTIGYGILSGTKNRIPYSIRYKDSYLVCGLVAVTVYAQFFSLFGRVGLAANVIMSAAALAIAWRSRREFKSMIADMRNKIRDKRMGGSAKAFGVLFLFLLFSYGASRGMIHYDTGLYHAQSIRWIEEYGVVRGLGNLHCRLAYNSSSFALSALYSMSFLGGQSYHCAAGWLAFLLAVVCAEIVPSLQSGRIRTSDFARLMCVYYLVNIFDEMVSPASDYFMVLIAFYIVIRWLDLLEEEIKEIYPYAMLCVLCVFLITVKLSAALILILAVPPAVCLMKEKRVREILRYLFLGIVTLLPYLIRNVVISGWLVYPFTRIDLFDVPWKIPKGLADYDAKEIQVYGRGYSDVSLFDMPSKQWMPDWFRSLSRIDQCMTAAAAVSVVLLAVCGIGTVFGCWKRRRRFLPVQAAVACSFLFWLCTSPLMRYGCVYVYLTPAVVLGNLYVLYAAGGEKDGKPSEDRSSPGDTPGRKAVRRCAVFGSVMLLLYKAAALGGQICSSFENDHWLTQKDYDNYETAAYEINGVTFYYPKEGDRVGYESFPSAPVKADILFMGSSVEDGFMAADL